MVKNQGVPVKLPVATTSAPQDRKDYTSITVNQRASTSSTKNPSRARNLAARLTALKASQADPKIFINGDGKTEFDNVVAVLDETLQGRDQQSRHRDEKARRQRTGRDGEAALSHRVFLPCAPARFPLDLRLHPI